MARAFDLLIPPGVDVDPMYDTVARLAGSDLAVPQMLTLCGLSEESVTHPPKMYACFPITEMECEDLGRSGPFSFVHLSLVPMVSCG